MKEDWLFQFNSARRDDLAALKNKRLCRQSLGDLKVRLTEYEGAQSAYQESIRAYNQALAPDNISTLNNKGLCLMSLGNLEAELSQPEEAIANWNAALTAFSLSFVGLLAG